MSAIDLTTPEAKAAIAEAAEKLFDEKAVGLKNKNTELLEEVRGFKEKLKDFDPAEYKRLKNSERELTDKGIKDPVEFRKRIEDEFAPKLAQAEQERDAARKALNDSIIDGQLTNALVAAGVAPEFLRAVKADLSSAQKIDVVDGGAVVDGKPVADYVKAWSGTDGKSFIKAPDNNGGGGKGGNGGGAVGDKKASEMSRAEKADFIKEHGDDAWRTKVNNES